MFFILVCVIGFLLSIYMGFVYMQLKQNKFYVPLCDLSNRISCSSVLKDSYAKLLYIPNFVLGLGFYLMCILLYVYEYYVLLFVLTLISLAISLVLGYRLYVLRKVCVVCVFTYCINIVLFLLSSSLI